jgi:hypothetical protein
MNYGRDRTLKKLKIKANPPGGKPPEDSRKTGRRCLKAEIPTCYYGSEIAELTSGLSVHGAQATFSPFWGICDNVTMKDY